MLIIIALEHHGDTELVCDECDEDIEPEESEHIIYWHCPIEYNSSHPDGYNICNNCAHIPITEVTMDTEGEDSPLPALIDHSPIPVPNCKQGNHCIALQNIVSLLTKYAQVSDMADSMGNEDIVNTLNDWFHVMHKHDSNDEFDDIFNNLEFCDINNCTIFERHYRNRRKTKTDHE